VGQAGGGKRGSYNFLRAILVSPAQIITRAIPDGVDRQKRLHFGEKVFIHIPRRRKSPIYAPSGNIFLGAAPRDVSFTPRKV